MWFWEQCWQTYYFWHFILTIRWSPQKLTCELLGNFPSLCVCFLDTERISKGLRKDEILPHTIEVVVWCAIYGNHSFTQLTGFKKQGREVSWIPVLFMLYNTVCLKYKDWLVLVFSTKSKLLGKGDKTFTLSPFILVILVENYANMKGIEIQTVCQKVTEVGE